MTLIQDLREVLPVAQLAMRDPYVNYKLNLQVGFTTNEVDAFAYFDGTILVESVWATDDMWLRRGLPRLITIGELEEQGEQS
jgi:hypothetical protein